MGKPASFEKSATKKATKNKTISLGLTILIPFRRMPYLRFFDNTDLIIGQAVKLIDELIDLIIRRFDLALKGFLFMGSPGLL
jgi:hypothetical protein